MKIEPPEVLTVRFLHLLPPELAHRVAIFFLKVLQFLRRKKRSRLARSAIQITSSWVVQSRIGLAAGFDKNAEVVQALSWFGFGFLEVGTVTPKAQPGNISPRIWRYPPRALINHLGFNNIGLECVRKNLLRLRPRVTVPILVNIGKGRDTPNEHALADYRTLIENLTDVADGFVVNISSPNTPSLTNLQNADFINSIAAFLPKKLPNWLKLSPDLENSELLELFAMIRRMDSLSGVVLTNSSRKLADSLYHSSVGGLSGQPLFERSLECVSLARKNLPSSKIVIGVGGVTTVDRAVKMRQAGADLIEVFTGFVYEGPRLVREIAKAIS